VLCWSVSADVEALAWNPSSPTNFLVSTEDGLVICCDARTGAGKGLAELLNNCGAGSTICGHQWGLCCAALSCLQPDVHQ
jgi:periodic tryptophan protein 1